MEGISWVWFFVISSLILIAKLFFGLSWLNLWYSLLGLFEASALSHQLHWSYWFLFVALFVFILIRKLILQKLRDNYVLLYYLAGGWILLSLGLFFVNQMSLAWALVIYLIGMLIFLRILFSLNHKPWSLEELLLLMILGEFFLLGIYLSIKILPLSLLLLATFYYLKREYFSEEIRKESKID